MAQRKRDMNRLVRTLVRHQGYGVGAGRKQKGLSGEGGGERGPSRGEGGKDKEGKSRLMNGEGARAIGRRRSSVSNRSNQSTRQSRGGDAPNPAGRG